MRRLKVFLGLILFLLGSQSFQMSRPIASVQNLQEDTTFKNTQVRYPRVKEAFYNQEISMLTLLANRGIDTKNFEIYIRIFKLEQVVEVWAKSKPDSSFKHVVNFPFCTTVGELGPKRRQGDYQIPEGFYFLSMFNPMSNYHLSLKVSYPNRSDSILSTHKDLGGEIFVHGGCSTIGCVPIYDKEIEALYVLSVLAKGFGQENIPIHIFPCRMNYPNMKMIVAMPGMKKNDAFWQTLKPCYDAFEMSGIIPKIVVTNSGRYVYPM